MQLDEGMDSGPIIAQQETTIGVNETAEDLTVRLFGMGARLLADTLPRWRTGEVAPVLQSEGDATITRLLKREDGEIDWARPADQIARQIRAYHPWPGTYTHWNGKQLKVHQAEPLDNDEDFAPGTVVEIDQGIGQGIGVATGEGILLIQRVQPEGRQAMDIGDFTRGYRGFVGSRLGAS